MTVTAPRAPGPQAGGDAMSDLPGRPRAVRSEPPGRPEAATPALPGRTEERDV
ncbi:hypothetical protein SAMN05216275_106234 [Streptosporangium canum]|uniref:Uncharacterized protein n=1 Tax=Streptosporangium canum TaxID=324952 RepID=A0A1I3NIK3_9ACTN|nr:hypothetical protein SAMN05216275_106234 [Streptosporangium canum]